MNEEMAPLYRERKAILDRFNPSSINEDYTCDEDYAQDIPVTYIDHINTPEEEQPNLVDTLECMADAHIEEMAYNPAGKDTGFWRRHDYENTRSRIARSLKEIKEKKAEIKEIRNKLAAYRQSKKPLYVQAVRAGDSETKAKITKNGKAYVKRCLTMQNKLEVQIQELNTLIAYLKPLCGWSDKDYGLRRFLCSEVVVSKSKTDKGGKGLVGMTEEEYMEMRTDIRAQQKWANEKGKKIEVLKARLAKGKKMYWQAKGQLDKLNNRSHGTAEKKAELEAFMAKCVKLGRELRVELDRLSK
jgi:hypothetical protein